MTSTKEAALLMSSLSVYRGILERTVTGAYYDLLCSIEKPVIEFTAAWGKFFSLLCERGYTDSLSRCITKAALYDENSFTRAAAEGTERDLPPRLIAAVRRDVSALLRVSSLSPDTILNDYRFRDELGAAANSLPRWDVGKPVTEFLNEEEALDALSSFHHRNGCGMFARFRAFIWRNQKIEPVIHPDNIDIDMLIGYDYQRNTVAENTLSFLHGGQGNNCLLYGDRGTGKSSTVKALLNRYYTEGLRMVEIPKDRLSEFPLLVEKIAHLPLKFIIFIDDLSFSSEDKSYAQLKAVLEGGLAVRPDNTLIYATSNRRHIVKESFSERDGDDIHYNDTVQEALSLSDRFGLSVNFSKPDKQQYLAIVCGLAKEHRLNISVEELTKGAERFAIERGGRSPRCAKQYITSLCRGSDK